MPFSQNPACRFFFIQPILDREKIALNLEYSLIPSWWAFLEAFDYQTSYIETVPLCTPLLAWHMAALSKPKKLLSRLEACDSVEAAEQWQTRADYEPRTRKQECRSHQKLQFGRRLQLFLFRTTIAYAGEVGNSFRTASAAVFETFNNFIENMEHIRAH